MDLRIFTEPQQGASYDTLLAVARAAEERDFDAFFRSDHYLVMGDHDGRPGPTDAWTTLAGLARDTTRIRLGTLVSSATFRQPGPLAVTVAQVDQMSHGRVELGLGTGWYEEEHRAFGVPFPPLKERFDRLEEQLEILTGLWASDGPFSYEGTYYSLVDNPGLVTPVQSPLPLVVGGGGPRRTPRLAATYASEFNMPFASVDDTAAQFARVRGGVREHRDGPLRCPRPRCCAWVGTTPRSAAAPTRSGPTPTSCVGRASRGRRPRSSTRSAGSPPPAPPASTCRCSTCRTSTTWTWSPRRSLPSSERGG